MLYCSMVNALFLSLFLTKILVVIVVSHKKLAKIANREDPDQTASSEADYRNFYGKKITIDQVTSTFCQIFFN